MSQKYFFSKNLLKFFCLFQNQNDRDRGAPTKKIPQIMLLILSIRNDTPFRWSSLIYTRKKKRPTDPLFFLAKKKNTFLPANIILKSISIKKLHHIHLIILLSSNNSFILIYPLFLFSPHNYNT